MTEKQVGREGEPMSLLEGEGAGAVRARLRYGLKMPLNSAAGTSLVTVE